MGNTSHAVALDRIKALAIILVMALHFFGQLAGWHINIVSSAWLANYWQDFSWLKVSQFFVAYSFLGVNLFVIASGFGLHLSHLRAGRPFSWTHFLHKRVARLLPGAALSVLLVYFLKVWLLDIHANTNWWLNFFPFLAGLNLFSPNWFFPPINGETWFLGLIIQLYLLFPLLLALRAKLGTKYFLATCLLFSFAARATIYFCFPENAGMLSFGLSFGRVGEFAFGMCAAENFLHAKKISGWWLLGFVLALGYFFAWAFPFADALLGIALFTLLWKIWEHAPENKVWSHLATQSYLIFLLHHPLIWHLNKLGLNDMWTLAGLGVFLGVIIVSDALAFCANLALDKTEKHAKRLLKLAGLC